MNNNIGLFYTKKNDYYKYLIIIYTRNNFNNIQL